MFSEKSMFYSKTTRETRKEMEMGSKTWLPKREDALVDLMAIWQVKLPTSALQTAYGWVAAECTATVSAITTFTAARTAYQAAPTKGNHDLKEETKKAAVEAMRKFARERIRFNSKMNVAQKEEMGMLPPDPEPTPVPVPKTAPTSRPETDATLPGVVMLRYVGPKPYGVDRIEVAWAIPETLIDTPDLLPNRESFSHNPWTHTFGAGERSKKMFYSLRYLTKEGSGPWSDVREIVVP
jgi:hypothetical protein